MHHHIQLSNNSAEVNGGPVFMEWKTLMTGKDEERLMRKAIRWIEEQREEGEDWMACNYYQGERLVVAFNSNRDWQALSIVEGKHA